MIKWLPKDVIEKYGIWEPPGFDTDESVRFPPEGLEDIVAALEAHGCTVEPSPVELV
jgi:hypothetical protein